VAGCGRAGHEPGVSITVEAFDEMALDAGTDARADGCLAGGLSA